MCYEVFRFNFLYVREIRNFNFMYTEVPIKQTLSPQILEKWLKTTLEDSECNPIF